MLLASLAGIAAAIGLPGWADLILLALPCALASVILLLRGLLTRAKVRLRRGASFKVPNRTAASPGKKTRAASRLPPGKVIVVDGSNVMHWSDGAPQLETVRAVVDHLATLGFSPGVVFDANAGHLLTGKYRHHAAMGSLLGLPEDRVMVVDRGIPADLIILAAASDTGAQIVTNDRYRDWADTHALVGEPGRLVRGGFADGKLWLANCLDTTRPATP